MKADLRKLLKQYGCDDASAIQEKTFSDCKMSIKEIRDELFFIGNILYEDLHNEVYVAQIRVGLWKMSAATVAMQLQGKTLRCAGFAKEGKLKLGTLNKAFTKLEEVLYGAAYTAMDSIAYEDESWTPKDAEDREMTLDMAQLHLEALKGVLQMAEQNGHGNVEQIRGLLADAEGHLKNLEER